MFCLLQYLKMIPPALVSPVPIYCWPRLNFRSQRTNLDWVGCFAESNTTNVKAIHQSFGGFVGSFAQFQNIFNRMTENQQCLFIQNSKTESTRVDKVMSWFKAEEPPAFKLGSIEVWDFDRRYSIEKNAQKSKDWKQIVL